MKRRTQASCSAVMLKIDHKLDDTATRIFISLAMLLLCILIEIFGFNAWYFKLPTSSRGIFHVDLNDAQIDKSDMSEGTLVVHSSGSMRIRTPLYIARLEIYAANSSAFTVALWNDEKPKPGSPKQYSLNAASGKFAVVDTYAHADHARYEINVPVGNTAAIQSLTIINTLHINLWRLLFMLSTAFILCIFAFFHRKMVGNLPAVFAVVAVSVGLCTAMLIPPFAVFDEAEHFVKAYQIASFDFSANREVPIFWISNSDQFFAYRATASPSFESGLEKSDFIRRFASNDYSNKQFYSTTAANYTPVAYIPAAFGVLLGKSVRLPFIAVFYLGRIFSLLAYVLIGYFILKSLKVVQHLVFALLLLPSMLYSASGYSADGLTYLLAIAVVALFLNLLTRPNGTVKLSGILAFSFVAALSAATKVAYAPLCLLILTIPRNRFATPTRAKHMKLLSLFIVGITTLLCLKITLSVPVNAWSIPNVNAHQQLFYIFTHPFTYLDMVFRQFLRQASDVASGCTVFFAYSGAMDTFWQYFCVVGLFILAIISLENEPQILSKSNRVALFLSICLCWGAVATALYIGYTPVRSSSVDGLQGRYFAPLLLPALLLLHNGKAVYKIKPQKLNLALEIACAFVLVLMNHFLLVNFNN